MTGQEQQMLNGLVQKVNQTNLQDKDSDAEQLLNSGLGRNPDSIYILAQTVLVQNLALDQARQQLTVLRQQAQQPAKPTSFLGGLFGHHDAPQQQPQAQYQPVQTQYAHPQYAAQQPAYQAPATGQPSFLRSAATTAAGVAGGMLAFEGVESLLHGGMGGYGGGFGGGFGGDAPREEIVNNYYDSPGGDQGGQGNDQNWIAGPDEQQQGPLDNGGDSGQDASNYGDDYSDGGGDFGGDDDSNFS